jgi:hypothetical protein
MNFRLQKVSIHSLNFASDLSFRKMFPWCIYMTHSSIVIFTKYLLGLCTYTPFYYSRGRTCSTH